MSHYSLAALAQHLDGVLHGDACKPIQGVASLSLASQTDLSYFNHPTLMESLDNTQAGGVLVTETFLPYCRGNAIVVPDPLSSMAMAAALFIPKMNFYKGVHPTAIVSPDATIGKEVSIGENTVIGPEVILGDSVFIGANCVLENRVTVGAHTIIHHGVSLLHGVKIGNRTVIESGVIVGAAPFNSHKEQGCWHVGPAVGGVLLADEVRLGANTVVTRGSLGDTFIASGVHIDNLVMIAHDVIIGANSAVAGCAVIGAYAQLGEHCIVGGASCIAPYVHLADDIVITGMSTVNKSLTKPGVYSSGTMVCEHSQWRRNAARFRRLDDYITRLINLEKERSWTDSHKDSI
ncbi:UDP-3-O-(3-hydroxymyristoyl)glucosamine N-acyltransferase [Legionella jamestowniensis]|uniref:UDP-3-O-[3-hydroxymyristoyl] glucosamine N-acyltransferase n=1 Tax=Legionella jamestowniensis TaxID=455 RepID=A0A0W0UKM6_9GAMM|nr:UDP-3-O-(3-hydroxymyristoyl)glucosamine N-acyltransferase [Legionella jamestowniensis]KTD08462.1 UDP-3-O-[3-hydroxymyristoyl] glucosamine N-acyltransferase [Legionella jamestowniensis]SFL51399.1 UDP-3-O-[3-hydroxymyristoyl] glucosamine N-acyltransferase [Legionella jamestowniensis DSM 19215]